jgi:hypothetical protein
LLPDRAVQYQLTKARSFQKIMRLDDFLQACFMAAVTAICVGVIFFDKLLEALLDIFGACRVLKVKHLQGAALAGCDMRAIGAAAQ